MNTERVIARDLKNRANYKDVSQEQTLLTELLPDAVLREDEVALGVYENAPGEIHKSILITNRGLHVCFDDDWLIIEYKDIEAVGSSEIKEDIDGVTITLSSGQHLFLPIYGRKGKFKDALPFMHFLMRVKGMPLLH